MLTHQKIGALALAGLFGMTLWGCPKESAPETTTAPTATTKPTDAGGTQPGAGGKQLKIAVIPKGTANSFWLSVKAGADAAASELKQPEPIWQGPAKEGDVTQQVDVVQTQINNKVDGIVLAAVDSEALVQPVKAAADKKILTVTVDSGLSKDQDPSIAYIATDNVKGGELAGETLAKLIGNKGEVGVLMFKKGSGSNDEREKGFMEAMKKFPDIKVVFNQEAGDPTKAVDQTNNMLIANPKIAGIFAANQPNGEGAISVLKQKKLGGKIKVVAFDASADELSALKDGTIHGLIVQDPFQMGYKGYKVLAAAINGTMPTEKTVDSGVKVVTMENLNSPEVQKLLK